MAKRQCLTMGWQEAMYWKKVSECLGSLEVLCTTHHVDFDHLGEEEWKLRSKWGPEVGPSCHPDGSAVLAVVVVG